MASWWKTPVRNRGGQDMQIELRAYWGKAVVDENGSTHHLLVYHCLDVAAVAACWWQRDVALRQSFLRAGGGTEAYVRAWLLFFIALHDLGKFDIRFQLKAPTVAG